MSWNRSPTCGETDRAAILSSSEKITKSLQARPAAQPGEELLSPHILEQATHTIAQSYDWQNGGWGSAPKFPQPMLIEFVLRQAISGRSPQSRYGCPRLALDGPRWDV